MFRKKQPGLALLLLALPLLVSAQERIAIEALGELELAWAPLEPMTRIPGPELRAEALPEAGAAYQFHLPAAAQQADFLLPPGSAVTEGNVVAVLEGPEIHHWQLAGEALEARFQTARERYQRNLPLYREGALSGDRWAAIEAGYFELRLEHEHWNHLAEWLQPGLEDRPESLRVLAPRDGIILFDSDNAMLGMDETLFEIVPADRLRLRVEVPADRAGQLAALVWEGCTVEIERVEAQARGFYRSAWSLPLPDDCALAPGSAISVSPRYTQAALRVPREAVFQWRREPHVWLRQADSLVAQPVELLADAPTGYAVLATPELRGGQVLVRSVSAAQGMLLGLGGD